MKKTIIILLLGIFTGALLTHFFIMKITPFNYVFTESVPEFTLEEKKFIRQNICSIYKKLEEPEKHYISNISLGDTVIISISALCLLQDGSDSTGTIGQITAYGTKTLLFNKKGRYIGKN